MHGYVALSFVMDIFVWIGVKKANVMWELLHAYVVMLTIITDISAVSVGVLDRLYVLKPEPTQPSYPRDLHWHAWNFQHWQGLRVELRQWKWWQ